MSNLSCHDFYTWLMAQSGESKPTLSAWLASQGITPTPRRSWVRHGNTSTLVPDWMLIFGSFNQNGWDTYKSYTLTMKTLDLQKAETWTSYFHHHPGEWDIQYNVLSHYFSVNLGMNFFANCVQYGAVTWRDDDLLDLPIWARLLWNDIEEVKEQGQKTISSSFIVISVMHIEEGLHKDDLFDEEPPEEEWELF